MAVGALVAACASAYAETPVYSVNVMGFQKIPVPAQGLNIAGAPYKRPSSEINDVIGDQLTPGVDISTGDTVFFFDPASQSYRISYLYNDGGQGVWRDSFSNQTATNPVPPGVGFWIKSNQGVPQDLYVSGNVVTNATYSQAVYPGLQLLSYPYSSRIPMNEMALAGAAKKGSSLSSSDVIYLWDVNAQQFVIYFYYTDGTLVDFATGEAATNALQPGAAFWYKHIGSGFTWVETNRYTLP